MAAYVATERIIRAHPRFVGADLGWSGRDALTEGAEWVAGTEPIDSRPTEQWIQQAIGDLREAWAQTTFFLFDPNSWR